METTTTGPIRLSFESKQTVVVIPENEDRFLITSRAAAQACQRAESEQEWSAQFSDFLKFLHGWCESHSDKVRACYVTVGDNGMNVLILLRSDHYDFDFDDDLADLDLTLFQQFPMCTADVIQVPDQPALIEEVQSDQLESEALIVYGDGAGSS